MKTEHKLAKHLDASLLISFSLLETTTWKNKNELEFLFFYSKTTKTEKIPPVLRGSNETTKMVEKSNVHGNDQTKIIYKELKGKKKEEVKLDNLR